MSKKLLLLIMLASSQHVFTQNWTNTKINIWQAIHEGNAVLGNKLNDGVKEEIHLFQMDKTALIAVLKNAPKRDSLNTFSVKTQHAITILQVPMPDGSWQQFQIMESSVMHPVLAEKFPHIKSFKGIGLEESTASIYFDISPLGFHGMVFSEKFGDVFIEPLNNNYDRIYKVFSKRETEKKHAYECFTDHNVLDGGKTNNNTDNTNNKSSFCGLKTFRIALSCTGEYAQFHGGTKELALAAMHTTLTRINGIFERDLSVSLQMVPDNDLLVFLNPYSDPFTNSNAWEMLGQNQQTCDDLIGENAYDIGHLFSTNGGGLAQLRSLCKKGIKAQGVTGIASPEGDAFNIDYVAHEMGHQFGANHTHNNNCNRYSPTAIEPGSGSSIMGYAGVCHPNVKMNSDAYFHAISIEEISNYLENDGNICGDIFSNNHSITADAGADYIIPKSTSFVLTGTAVSDIPTEHFLFNWEQIDNEVSFMPPNGSNHTGPMFRSVPPSAQPRRYFPNLSALARNETPLWEVIPNCERDMDFIFSVRTNGDMGGCSGKDKMTVHVFANAGPFSILSTSPSSWAGGSNQTVVWDVAETASEPVNCQFVDLFLSDDGGLNYAYELAANVPNDGRQEITVPNINTGQARIMVKAAGNIFFDISDDDISIVPSTQFWATLEVSSPECMGENNGSVKANVFGGDGDSFYKWNTGETGSLINGLIDGNYSVTVTSGKDSVIASTVIHSPPPINIDFEILELEGSSTKTIKALATGGTGNFKYYWEDDGSTEQVKRVGPSGEYVVIVTDGNGCQNSKKYTHKMGGQQNGESPEEQFLASRPNAKKYVKTFPNPVSDILQIEFYQAYLGGPVLRVFDSLGREMYKSTLLQQEAGLRKAGINLANLKDGCYMLQVEEGGNFKIARFVKI